MSDEYHEWLAKVRQIATWMLQVTPDGRSLVPTTLPPESVLERIYNRGRMTPYQVARAASRR